MSRSKRRLRLRIWYRQHCSGKPVSIIAIATRTLIGSAFIDYGYKAARISGAHIHPVNADPKTIAALIRPEHARQQLSRKGKYQIVCLRDAMIGPFGHPSHAAYRS